MMTLDEIRAKLEDRNLQAVAKGAGIHPNAIYRLMSGGTNPAYDTVQKLVSYLEKKEL